MEFPVSREGIREALDALLADAGAKGVPRPVALRIAVIVDEYCSNLIRHDSTIAADSMFSVSLERVPEGAAITIRDQGQPFDPTIPRQVAPDAIGGQGLAVMRGLSRRLEYHTADGWNRFQALVADQKGAGDGID